MAKTRKMVVGAVLTALVVILQWGLGSIKLAGLFTINWALIPIIIGSATCGRYVGAWLGFVFSAIVMAAGDAAPFWAISEIATICVVFVKGVLCGYVAGVVYEIVNKLSRNNVYISTLATGVVCPIVNTGIFALGTLLFFIPGIEKNWNVENGVNYLFTILIGWNFIVEVVLNIVLSPVMTRILKVVKK